MPYPNEHAARINSPKKYKSFARQKIASGISLILGIKEDGKSETQAYRFKKTIFTAEQAKTWLKDHDIKYISFEEAVDVQAFNVELQCFKLDAITQDEILRHIEPDLLKKIKVKDSHPFFTAYSIAHEGLSNPTILNEPTNKPILWIKKAIQSIKNKFKNGIKFFSKHNKDNSINNRESYGEVVGNYQKEINGILNHIVIGYHPKDKVEKVKKMDICSQEGVWNLIDTGKQFLAEGLEKITGIALGKSGEEKPAFSGAQRLGMVQAFEINGNPGRKEIMAVTYEDLMTTDIKLFKRVAIDRGMHASQILGEEYDMRDDRVFGKIYRDYERLQEENQKLNAELKKANDEIGVYKSEKERAVRKAQQQTAKSRIDNFIVDLPGTEKIYIAGEIDLDRMENLDDSALQKEIDRLSANYKRHAARGIFKEDTKPEDKPDDKQGDKKEGNPADKDKNNEDIDFSLPENNPLLVNEESK